MKGSVREIAQILRLRLVRFGDKPTGIVLQVCSGLLIAFGGGGGLMGALLILVAACVWLFFPQHLDASIFNHSIPEIYTLTVFWAAVSFAVLGWWLPSLIANTNQQVRHHRATANLLYQALLRVIPYTEPDGTARWEVTPGPGGDVDGGTHTLWLPTRWGTLLKLTTEDVSGRREVAAEVTTQTLLSAALVSQGRDRQVSARLLDADGALRGNRLRVSATLDPNTEPDEVLRFADRLGELLMWSSKPGGDGAPETMLPFKRRASPPAEVDLKAPRDAQPIEAPMGVVPSAGLRRWMTMSGVGFRSVVALLTVGGAALVVAASVWGVWALIGGLFLFASAVSGFSLIEPHAWLRALPTQRGAPARMMLREGCLHLDQRKINLTEPFTLHLTQHPETRMLGVDLSQTCAGEQTRLRLRVPLAERLDALPAYAQPGALIAPEDFREWLWPTLRFAASLHGEDPGYAVVDDEAAAVVSVAAANAVARQ